MDINEQLREPFVEQPANIAIQMAMNIGIFFIV